MTMKKYLIRTIALCCALIAGFSCQKDEDRESVLETKTLCFTMEQSQQTLELSLGRISNYWHVYSPTADTWLQTEVVPGRQSMIVAVNANTSGAVRSSYVMARCGYLTQRIEVVQNAAAAVALSQNAVQITAEGTSEPLLVSVLNAEYLTSLELNPLAEQDRWCSVLLQDNVLRIEAEENPVKEERVATVTVRGTFFTGEQGEGVVTVRQAAAGADCFVIEIPDFSESLVYKVMDGEVQIAQITREFLRAKYLVNAQAVVVYPVENGEVDLSCGYVAQVLLENDDLSNSTDALAYAAPVGAVHGGTVVFDAQIEAANRALSNDASATANALVAYTPGAESEPVSRVYLVGYAGFQASEMPRSRPTVVEPCLITDTRADETCVYPVVKVGMQYWMGSHLNTARYNANKNFEPIPTGVAPGSKVVTANVCVWGNNDIHADDPEIAATRAKYGLLYNFLSIGGYETFADTGLEAYANQTDNLSPEGWIVPALIDWKVLAAYVVRVSTLRNFDEQKAVDDNITGFGAPNSSYRNNSSFVAMGADNGCFMLSRTNVNGTYCGAIHMGSVRTDQTFTRNMAVRCLNNGAIPVKGL